MRDTYERNEPEMKLERVRKITKIVASAIVGAGTTKLVKQVIDHNTDPSEKKLDKLQIGVASSVVGAMAVERTKSYTDDKIDRFFDRWDNAGKTPEITTEEPTSDPQ